MRNVLHRVDATGNNAGLKLNAKKTKVMHITGPGSQGPQQIRINGTDLEKITDFKYLGSIKASDGTCTKDIKCRIGMAKQKMVQFNNIWKDKGVPRELKIRILKCLIWPVVLYGSKAWALRKDDENRIQAAEMWSYRRLLRVKWTDKRTNESVQKELGVQCLMLSEISKKRLKYLGHANRNTKNRPDDNCAAGQSRGKKTSRKASYIVH
jgi:hypothetical protein